MTFDKLLLIGLLVLVLIGPTRLPGVARRLGEWARRGRDLLGGARERMRSEMGDEFDDIDWKQLDPRRYDPRRIIREALAEPSSADAAPVPVESPYVQRQRQLRAEREAREAAEAAPFDSEST